MKKTLLIAAALVCSGVAQAEAWFCEPATQVFWLHEGYLEVKKGRQQVTLTELTNSFDIHSDESLPLKGRLIIDTMKGVKVFDGIGTEIYEGDCQNMADGIKCKTDSKYADQTIWVLNTITEIYSETFVSPTLIQSQKGTCKKI